MQPETNFNLGDKVTIEASGEAGQVIARCEYLNAETSYLLRYRANDGRAVEQWWPHSAVKPSN